MNDDTSLHAAVSPAADDVERALAEACRQGHAEVLAFTVAPRSPEDPRRGHEWLIEFADPPRAPDVFVGALDGALQRLSAPYRVARAAGIAAPRVVELPAGTFERWSRVTGPGRRQAPRLAGDRAVADALLAAAARPAASRKVYPAVIVL